MCTKATLGDCMFFTNFVEQCNKANLSPSAAAEAMGFQRSVVTRWSKGTEPRAATLQKIADFFGCSVDELKKEKPTIVSDGELPESKRDMINLLCSLSPEEFEKKKDALFAVLLL